MTLAVLIILAATYFVLEQIRAAESRGLDRGRHEEAAKRPPPDPNSKQLEAQVDALKSEVSRLELALQQAQSDLREARDETGRMTEARNRISHELHQSENKLKNKRARSSLIEDGWLPLHASCLPVFGEHILVGGITNGGPLLSNDLDAWYAVFEGEENGRIRLENGRGDGLWVDSEGEALWISHGQWQASVDRSRTHQALHSLNSPNGVG